MDKKHLLLATLMSVIFGMGWVFAKSALDYFPPILLAAFRFGVTALVVIWFVKPPKGKMKEIMLISFLAVTIPYSMSYTGMKDLDVSTTILLVQLEAPCLILLGALLLGEKPGIRKSIGVLIAFTGVILIAGDPKLHGNALAIFWVIGSIVTWAIGQIKIRKLGDFGGLRSVAWIAAFSTPQLLLASVIFETDQLQLIRSADWTIWATVIYLGIAMTAIGIGIWYHLIGKYPVADVGPFLLLVPVTTIIGGVTMLDESLTTATMIGGGIVIVGISLVVLERRPENQHVKVVETLPEG
ncbi:EamA family transporter [Thalassospira sp. MA62]|nr:EamA family transporter [Thalassospira sp. MA62]